MIPIADEFEFDYFGSDIVYGRGCVNELGGHLADRGFTAALVVCGSNVGSNDAVMEPLRRGLDDHLAGVFDGTTPDKTIETVFDGIDVMHSVNPDVLVGIGGGSSLDIARQMSVFSADGRQLAAYRKAALDGRMISPENAKNRIPVVVIPTTFAGADISDSGSIVVLSASESPTGQPIRTRGSAMPTMIVYDPDLFETTPEGPLARSAMNGFNKGIETIYARTANPMTDAAAIHGLRLLHEGYLNLQNDRTAIDRTVSGIILVQFRRQLSLVHAVGHGFSARYPIQQGIIHAVMVPHVLQYIFEKVDGRRTLVAEGLNIDRADLDDDELATAIIEEVVAVRDSFDLPTRLSELEVVDKADFTALAEFILDDYLMPLAPESLDPSVQEIERMLQNAW